MGPSPPSTDRWRVLYADGTVSRLSPQLGERGMAVVVKSDAQPVPYGCRQQDDNRRLADGDDLE